MNRKMIVCAGSLLSALLVLGLVASAQEKKPADPPKAPSTGEKRPEGKPADAKPSEGAGEQAMTPEQEKMMQAWMEYATPGEHHKHLQALVGKYEYTMTWQMTPDAPKEESTGTAEFKSMFDGRYVALEVSAPPKPPMGDFKGHGVYGYDNARKKHFCSWFDNMSTGFMVLYGTCSADGKVLTYTGEEPDPMDGNKIKKVRSVMTIGENESKFEWFQPGADGKEFKSGEILYKRVGGKPAAAAPAKP